MSHEVPQPPQEDSQQSFVFPEWEEKTGKKLMPGYHYDENGEIVDWEGKIWHANGELKSTPALSKLGKEIERLKEARPDLANNREALMTLARINLSPKKPEKRGDRYSNEDPNYH